MQKCFSTCLLIAMSLLGIAAHAQTDSDSTLLGLPGDNLDLYAVLDLFQKSPTIEEFEKSLNLESTGVNNLDLNLDGNVDFIKVETKQDGDDFTFILQVPVSEKEKQDVAVILLSKDDNKKVTMEIVGDPDLYGKDYIVELRETVKPAVTANPAYTGKDTVIVSAPATTTVVVVETTPVVQYVYSPAYVPYYPPYYYGYYPPYYRAFTVMAIGIYRHNNYYHHYGHGYHGNTVIINNRNIYNNYNNSRNRSNTVSDNMAKGNYNRANNVSTRPATGTATRPSAGTSARPSAGTSARPSAGTSARPTTGTSARPSTGTPANRSSTSARPSTQSRPSSAGASRYSGAATSRSSAGFSGGGSRGGGMRRGGRN